MKKRKITNTNKRKVTLVYLFRIGLASRNLDQLCQRCQIAFVHPLSKIELPTHDLVIILEQKGKLERNTCLFAAFCSWIFSSSVKRYSLGLAGFSFASFEPKISNRILTFCLFIYSRASARGSAILEAILWRRRLIKRGKEKQNLNNKIGNVSQKTEGNSSFYFLSFEFFSCSVLVCYQINF